MAHGLDQQRRAVDSAVWPLYRFDPRRIVAGEPPLTLDSGAPKMKVKDYMQEEARFRITEHLDSERYKQLLRWAQKDTEQRFAVYEQLSKMVIPQITDIPDPNPPPAESAS